MVHAHAHAHNITADSLVPVNTSQYFCLCCCAAGPGASIKAPLTVLLFFTFNGGNASFGSNKLFRLPSETRRYAFLFKIRKVISKCKKKKFRTFVCVTSNKQ